VSLNGNLISVFSSDIHIIGTTANWLGRLCREGLYKSYRPLYHIILLTYLRSSVISYIQHYITLRTWWY